MTISEINPALVQRISFRNETQSDIQTDIKNSEPNEQIYGRFHTGTLNKDTFKDPVIVAGTVAGAALLSYLSVQCIAAGVLARFAPKLSVSFENGMRKTANDIRDKAKKWTSVKSDTVFSKIKKTAGNVIGKAESGIRSLYKSIAYIGLPDTMQGAERAYNSLGNVAGTGAFFVTTYKLCTKDDDGDGIKDIMQKKN